jgi:hypothetical protein
MAMLNNQMVEQTDRKCTVDIVGDFMILLYFLLGSTIWPHALLNLIYIQDRRSFDLTSQAIT